MMQAVCVAQVVGAGWGVYCRVPTVWYDHDKESRSRMMMRIYLACTPHRGRWCWLMSDALALLCFSVRSRSVFQKRLGRASQIELYSPGAHACAPARMPTTARCASLAQHAHSRCMHVWPLQPCTAVHAALHAGARSAPHSCALADAIIQRSAGTAPSATRAPRI